MTAEAPKGPGIIDEIRAEIKAQRVEQTLTEEEMARRKALADDLFELCENQDFLDLILRRDNMARSEVEVYLCNGGRDDLDSMYFGEELVLTVTRPRYWRRWGAITARQRLSNINLLFDGIKSFPRGKELVIKNKVNKLLESK